MPSSSKKSYGPEVQARVRGLLQAILERVAGERELGSGLTLKWDWSADDRKLTIETTLKALVLLNQPELKANTLEFNRAKSQAGECLTDLREFVGILEDHRTQKRGSDKWHFSLRLSGRDIQRNLAEFDKLWSSKRSPAPKPQPTPGSQPKSPLKPGVPFPNLRLPDNFVERSAALAAVKQRLLAESDRPLVVSAIAGLGGLGKSVLAAAVVLDRQVQARFEDGVLWVTLGQKPDLQTLLGDWIRELDKSREAFSANTPESASRYLDSLLVERRMLLVVDDVWHAEHVKWFRVGGAGCRVLVTTREAQIEGAEYYPLALMSEAEAIDLVRRKLGEQWRSEQAAGVKAFAKVLGYLPLALDLAANQVRDGLSWAELRSEFKAERRSVALGRGRRSSALKLLDSPEAWEHLDENEQRKYSLQACFNLSLQRLTSEQRRQFAGLGVLPEDVNLQADVAAVLWDLPLVHAKRGLGLLRSRSFLTSGVATIAGEPTYRVHDLMHDMARSLIEEGVLAAEGQPAGSAAENLALVHRQFLERYRECSADRSWFKLPNDGYIHRHLTWHMERANWSEAIHELMSMDDELGRNAWFEACDRIGQPAIFVEDVGRGWKIAEQEYELDRARSIGLQCRYALITVTLNSLVSNLPVEMMAEFVKRSFWTVEQAWAYVEQMQHEWKIAEAIQALAPYLSRSLFQVAVGKARWIQDGSMRAKALCNLAQVDETYFVEALNAVGWIQDESRRASALGSLVQVDGADFTTLLEAARSIQDEPSRAEALSSLTQVDGADFTALLDAARSIQSESWWAWVLRSLVQVDGSDFTTLLDAANSIQSAFSRAWVLRSLVQVDGSDFTALLEAARSIQDESSRAEALSSLTQVDGADFTALLDAARSIQNESSRAWVLRGLAQVDGADFAEALEAARSIQDDSNRAWALSSLAQVDETYFAEALEAARSIQDEPSQVKTLSSLAQVDGADFTALLDAARSIQDEFNRAKALSSLAQVDGACFAEALETARSVQDEYWRVKVLNSLTQADGADFTALLDAARSIQSESSRAKALSSLAQVDGAYFAEALDAARVIQDEYSRAKALSSLVQVDRADFTALLDTTRSIQSESSRAKALSSLAQLDGAYFAEALDAARVIQDEYSRAKALGSLVQVDGADFTALLEAARSIQSESSRAWALSSLAQVDRAYLAEALEAARSIQDKSSRASALSSLAQLDGTYFAEALNAVHSIQDESRRVETLSSLAQVDGADFTALLEAARSIQSEPRWAWALGSLAQVDGANFTVLLEATRSLQDESNRAWVLSSLAQVDRAYFADALEAAHSIQDESSRAWALSSLAQVDRAYFADALEAAHSIQDESSRAEALSSLAQVDGADFTALLEAAHSIQDESRHAKVLSSLTEQAPQNLLPTLQKLIFDLTHKPTRAKAFTHLLPRLPLTNLPYSDWKTFLHLLASRNRSNLMPDLATLYPAIQHLGGETAMPGVVEAMRQVCSQWK